tara:strand:+ start:175 stop:1287 length:1113 start_codon:yes stop_codon:yes gene_type:complete
MKILELTNYSAGICGVFSRVKEESLRLSKIGHEVKIFSSNFTKGSSKKASELDDFNGIEIKRFPTKKLGGESFMKWDFEKEAAKYNPDVIIAHSYRQYHTTKALKIKNKLKCKVFLVTHAPFARSSSRTLFQKLAVKFYDLIIGRCTLKKFNAVISITKWEIPYLLNLGLEKEKIFYSPNGLAEDFFKEKISSNERNLILFIGRIAPIKNLEILINSLASIENKKILLEIVGPPEEDYLKDLEKLVKKNNLKERVIFSKPIYGVKEKIEKIDSCKIFILPSKSEGMPQSLIEAMSRGKIVIASNIKASKEIIKDRTSGYLFAEGNVNDLASKINFVLKNNSDKIKKNSKESVREFSWDRIINNLNNLIIK